MCGEDSRRTVTGLVEEGTLRLLWSVAITGDLKDAGDSPSPPLVGESEMSPTSRLLRFTNLTPEALGLKLTGDRKSCFNSCVCACVWVGGCVSLSSSSSSSESEAYTAEAKY